MYILGAGLSGLIAATQFPDAVVFEAGDATQLSHRAVLRFRSDSLSRLTGIPFRSVTVRKSIWARGRHCRAAIDLANMYSRKTNGHFHDRSIWNLEPVERFIAPESLQQQMVEMIGRRIKFNHTVTPEELAEMPRPIISTIPMPALLKLRGIELGAMAEFRFKPIVVDRYRVKDADVFQTIYYPDDETQVYRASITGDLLIVERITSEPKEGDEARRWRELEVVAKSFGLSLHDLDEIDINHTQRFGKIAPINDAVRRDLIYQATAHDGIYSMGRFAIWKNVLLDDVVKDGAVIKRLINQGSYGASLHHFGKDKS